MEPTLSFSYTLVLPKDLSSAPCSFHSTYSFEWQHHSQGWNLYNLKFVLILDLCCEIQTVGFIQTVVIIHVRCYWRVLSRYLLMPQRQEGWNQAHHCLRLACSSPDPNLVNVIITYQQMEAEIWNLSQTSYHTTLSPKKTKLSANCISMYLLNQNMSFHHANYCPLWDPHNLSFGLL